MNKILLAYIPVLHEGYRRLLELHKDVDVIYVWGKVLISETDYLAKEIRALDPDLIKKSLENWGLNKKIEILDKENLEDVISFGGEIILPDDDVSHIFAEKYLKDKKIVFVSIFLRWDRTNSVKKNKIAEEQIIVTDEFSRKIMACAETEAQKSSDWWRQIGAVIIKNNKIILTGYNRQLPSEHSPYANGDPRNCFHRGENLESYTSIHAEAGLIAEAAKQGISLEGAEIYVTTFPCPPCARLIAYSGIKKIYYKEGYGVLDGEGIMKGKGIKIYFVQ